MLYAGLKMQRLAVSIDRFRLVAQTFHAFGNLHERTECSYAQHFAVDHIADVVGLEERFPHIGLKLLYAQRQPALVRLNGQHHGLHAITLLQHFGRMLHALGPAQVADVHQAVDAVFDFDEGSEVSQIANLAFDDAAWERLQRTLTPERIKAHFGDWVKGDVDVFPMKNINAFNILLHNALGGGATKTLRYDVTGKAFSTAMLRLELAD